MYAKTCQVIGCVDQGCIKCACAMHEQARMGQSVQNTQTMIKTRINTVSPKNLYSLESKRVKKYHRGILSNTRVHTLHICDKQCMNM